MIYTSFFYFKGLEGIPKERKVAISLGVPPNWSGPRYMALAPTRAMIKMSTPQYYQLYNAILAKLDPFAVGKALDGKILLCWEKNPAECHRSYVAQWLRKAGFQCQELTGGSPEVRTAGNQPEMPGFESRPPVQ